MPLKYMLESLDGVDESVAGLYEKTDNGFRLDVEGAVPREKLDEFRNNNIELNKKLEQFKGVDPTKYGDLLKLEENVKGKELMEAGKIDELVNSRTQSMRSEYEERINAQSTELQKANTQLESVLIDSAVRSKAMELGAESYAMEDILLRAKSSMKVVEGQAVPHKDGKPVYGKDGVHYMSLDEWISGLSKNAPHLFKARQGGGGNGRRPSGLGGSGGNMSSLDKIKSGLQG